MSQCNELRNIEYQTMLLSNNHSNKDKGILNINQDGDTKQTIDDILEQEQNSNLNQIPWSKLEKMYKIQKLNDFAEIYGKNENLNNDEIEKLKKFLLLCLNKRRLQRVKDVQYDKDAEMITNINRLHINSERNFTLKQTDKKSSTLKNLPKKKRTIKDKIKKNKID